MRVWAKVYSGAFSKVKLGGLAAQLVAVQSAPMARAPAYWGAAPVSAAAIGALPAWL